MGEEEIQDFPVPNMAMAMEDACDVISLAKASAGYDLLKFSRKLPGMLDFLSSDFLLLKARRIRVQFIFVEMLNSEHIKIYEKQSNVPKPALNSEYL